MSQPIRVGTSPAIIGENGGRMRRYWVLPRYLRSPAMGELLRDREEGGDGAGPLGLSDL